MTTVASSSYTPTIFTLFLPPLSSPHPRRARILLVLVATSRQSWPTSAMFSRPLRVFDNFEMALALILTRFCLASRQWWCGVLLEILIQFLVSREQGYVSELINLAGVGGALRRRGFFPPSSGIPLSKTVFHLCQPGIPWKFGSVFEIPEAGITSCTTSFSNPYRYLAVIMSRRCFRNFIQFTVFRRANLSIKAPPRLRAAAPNSDHILCVPATGVTISLFCVPASGVTRSRGFKNCANALPTLFLKNPTHWNLQMHADREYFKYFAFNYVFTHAPS
ncbi:hypothetical protein C8R43DRAFT_1104214 [Mycena crocata]|nr:hypothetical protein C8R43DRAFT_1104214 [Mycena crocata]